MPPSAFKHTFIDHLIVYINISIEITLFILILNFYTGIPLIDVQFREYHSIIILLAFSIVWVIRNWRYTCDVEIYY